MRDKHSTPKVLVSITAAVVLLLGAGASTVAWRLHDHAKAAKAGTAQTVAAKDTKAAATVSNISYPGKEGQNALALLQEKAKVVTEDSSYGPYVDSVNGVAGGANGKYWTFYVNGAQAQVGAGAYITHDTDNITWKFE
jgi:hypothetical protein